MGYIVSVIWIKYVDTKLIVMDRVQSVGIYVLVIWIKYVYTKLIVLDRVWSVGIYCISDLD